MELLKKEQWWLWLVLYLMGGNIFALFLGAILDVYDKDAWYAKPINWILGIVFFVFPAMIMFTIFTIQILVKVAAKLGVEGKEFYLSPYVWVLLLIVPIFGWIAFGVLNLYLQIMIIINLHNGHGEEFI